MRTRFHVDVANVERAANKLSRIANRSSPLMESLGGIAISVAMIYGGYSVIVAGATPGELFSFIAAFLLAYEPAKRLARLNIDLNGQLVFARSMFEIIDSVPTDPIEDGKPPITIREGRVVFDEVTFAYRADEPVLRAMSFVAEPGKTTALVGPSGGGKSTTLNLLLRFYDPDGGSILVDGQDVAALSRRSMRRQIAYVGQNVHLFHDSIYANIACGKSDATEAEIVAAAKAAHADEFIRAFPLGYNTPVGEHGLQLSGGQRQRVAIARALIKNAPLILLDEATASLDSESERTVQDALAVLCKDRTTIVIAHRLPTIMHADCILVIEGGAVAEAGRHEELLRRGGRYASFYRLQLADQTRRPSLAAKAAG
jgi:ATP-binding cassette, subfamily B, bacterial MsbA